MGSEELKSYLKHNCRGQKNAVKSPALEDALHISGNELRRQVNRLRRKKVPACSGPEGYFYARNAGEIYASLFYLDPPYHTTEGYYQNVGENGFTEADHFRLRDMLLGIEGKFLLSYNDDRFIRELYAHPGIMIREITRLNNMRQRFEGGSQFSELFIANYDMEERARATAQITLFE